MGKVTETDVVKHYFPLVIQECKNSYKGLEEEDRITEGVLALIYAIRTYRTKYGCFEDYFLLQLKIIMKQKNKEAWALKKLESIFSLNAPVLRRNDSSTRLDFVRSIPQDDTILDVDCFIESLSSTERQVALLLINERDLLGISNKLSLSLKQIQSVVKQLQIKVTDYLAVDK
ncbi:RNA polymerase factor sigma-70 [compost metagenome]